MPASRVRSHLQVEANQKWRKTAEVLLVGVRPSRESDEKNRREKDEFPLTFMVVDNILRA